MTLLKTLILYIQLHFTELFKIYIHFLEKTPSPKNKEGRKQGREERDKRKELKRKKNKGRSQDGGGIGWGDHFLSYKFIERIIERRAHFTKQLLIAS